MKHIKSHKKVTELMKEDFLIDSITGEDNEYMYDENQT